eukprot:2519835-Pleurochrysis_carterae.AAC.8
MFCDMPVKEVGPSVNTSYASAALCRMRPPGVSKLIALVAALVGAVAVAAAVTTATIVSAAMSLRRERSDRRKGHASRTDKTDDKASSEIAEITRQSASLIGPRMQTRDCPTDASNRETHGTWVQLCRRVVARPFAAPLPRTCVELRIGVQRLNTATPRRSRPVSRAGRTQSR